MKDKSAIIQDAQKYAAKGQIDKAITEWKKLLDEGKDGNVHNTIGDLYYKKGSETESIESYTKAAEIFMKDGFFPKATALYKKILHITPNNVNALIALAKLDAQRGLTGSAVDNYLKAAEVFKRDGIIEKTMQVIERIVELSPSDVNIKMKVADLYIRSSMVEKAINEYIEIANIYLENATYDKAQLFFNKVFESDPGNIKALLGQARVEEKLGNIDQAFEFLKTALEHHPEDRDALLTCSSMAIEHNKIEVAKDTLIRAMNVSPSDVEFKKLMGTVYLTENDLDQAWENLLPFIDEAIEAKNWNEAVGFLPNFRKQHPEPVMQRLITIYKALGENERLVPEMKELALFHKNAGSPGDALQIYKDLLNYSPGDDTVIHEINALESELGIAPTPVDDESPADHIDILSTADDFTSSDFAAPGDNLIAPEAIAEDDMIISDNAPSPIDVSLPEDDSLSSTFDLDPIELPGNREDPLVQPEEDPHISPEEFAERKAEADFFAQQGITDEALKIYEKLLAAFPDNDEIKKEISKLNPEAVKHEGAGAQETAPDEPIITIEQDKLAEELDDHAAATGAHNDHHDLHDIFTQFQANDEDYEYHYKRGKELKQKGRLDDAIRELQIAAKDPKKKLRNSCILALCYIEKGDYHLAIQEFSQVIEQLSPSDNGYFNIKYELARAYMGNKDYNKALELYSEIQEQSPDFKDVVHTINELKSLTSNTGVEPNAR